MLVAQFYSWYMFINPEDMEKFYQGCHPVFCVVYDIDSEIYRTAASTEQHFKFNPWEVLTKGRVRSEEESFQKEYREI